MKVCIILFYLLVTGGVAISQSSVSYVDGIYQINDSIIKRKTNLPQLLSQLDTSDLRFYTHAYEIPKHLSAFYRDVRGETLWLADPDADYNCCCTIVEELPSRRLIYFGTNGRMALLSYERGGGIASTRIVLIFKIENGSIIDFWGGDIWQADSAELDNRDAIVYYLRRYIHDHDYYSGMGRL